jgi:hypothetical protein
MRQGEALPFSTTPDASRRLDGERRCHQHGGLRDFKQDKTGHNE